MKKIIILSVISILGIFILTAGKAVPCQDKPAKVEYTCTMHPEVITDKPGQCPKCGMDLVKKEVAKVQYTCPMHPEVISDKPGNCTKCGMKLQKKVATTSDSTKVKKSCCGMKM